MTFCRKLIASFKLIGMLAVTSCVQDENIGNSSPHQGWNAINDPAHFAEWSKTTPNPTSYERVFMALPLRGALSKKPWAGDYWPTHRGGISFRWLSQDDIHSSIDYDLKPFEELNQEDIIAMSPSEKYDLFRGDPTYTATNFERDRTEVLATIPGHESFRQGFNIPTWDGLCHAWAPATLLYDSPRPVTLIGKSGHSIPFGASDIQALLSLFLDQALLEEDGDFIGERCEAEFAKIDERYARGEIDRYERQRLKNTEHCNDTNAGSFHLALSNDIGRLDRGFIMDLVRDNEVWNHPIFAYESAVLRHIPRASRGAAIGTESEVELETRVYYVGSGDYAFELEDPATYTRTADYRYKLELDKNGAIIGGSWVSDNQPDFIWKAKRPEFGGFFQELQTIYQASTSL